MSDTHQTTWELALRDDATLLESGKMDFSIFRYAYALSGGIGSGKSSACEIFSSLGYSIINADKIGHQVLKEKSREVIDAFGEEILEEGEISRAKLGKIVFKDQARLKELESILTLGIQEEIFRLCVIHEAQKKPFFVEIPILFEQRERYNFLHCILIACSEKKQIERVCQRNQLSADEVRKRMATQMPLKEKIPLAWKIFENEGSKEELRDRLEEWLANEFGSGS